MIRVNLFLVWYLPDGYESKTFKLAIPYLIASAQGILYSPMITLDDGPHKYECLYIPSLHNQDEYSLFQSAVLLLPCCFATKIRECTARMHKLNNFHTGQKRILSPFLYSYDRDLHPCIWLLCKGPFFYCHEERHFTWHCHFSVNLSCEMTVSGEMTLFVTVEKWTLSFYQPRSG